MSSKSIAWLATACLAYGARVPSADCGWFPASFQEEVFLHSRHLATHPAKFARSAASTVTRDVGDVAVIGDGDGVIGRRNAFNLDGKTLT